MKQVKYLIRSIAARDWVKAKLTVNNLYYGLLYTPNVPDFVIERVAKLRVKIIDRYEASKKLSND